MEVFDRLLCACDFFFFKCFSFHLYTQHQILSSLAEDSCACWKLWKMMWLKLLFKKLLIQCIWSRSLISTFQNFTSFPLQLCLSKRLMYFYLNCLTFPWDNLLKEQWFQRQFCDYFNIQSWHYGTDIIFTKKWCQQSNFSLTTDHKITLNVKNIGILTSKQCHIHKCLTEILTWMTQLSPAGQFLISPVIGALNNLKAYALL